jgi:hypothetical protein
MGTCAPLGAKRWGWGGGPCIIVTALLVCSREGGFWRGMLLCRFQLEERPRQPLTCVARQRPVALLFTTGLCVVWGCVCMVHATV